MSKGIYEILKLFSREWFAEIKSLNFFTAVFTEQIKLLKSLFPLGYGDHIEAVCHIDNGIDNGFIFRIVGNVSNEGLIDFKLINPKFFEVVQ